MLTELRLKNLAIVDEVAFSPGPGLNVISGETGAGKSILVGALELLFGGRGGPDLIRTGADMARIEGLFQFEDAQFLRKRGLDITLEDKTLLIVREIGRNGRSRILVNDEMATVARLKALGDALVEMHGQHEHQVLVHPETHVDYLDRFGSTPAGRTGGATLTPLDRYRRERAALLEVRTHLADLKARIREADERQDTLKKDAAEIEAAALKPGEEEELRTERRVLQHAEKLLESVQAAADDISEGEGAVDQRLAHAVKRLGQAAGLDPSLETLVRSIEEARLSLQDAGYRLARYRDGLQFEPDRSETIETRLALIGRLKRKYGGDEEAIAARGRELRTQLESLTNQEAWLDSVKADEARAADATLSAGRVLREWRQGAARKLEKGVALEFSSLGMTKATLQVRMEPLPDTKEGLLDGGVPVAVGEKGIDRIEFFLAANPGEEPRPLAKVASGGELSRIMLALKTVLRSADPVPILIFDEVDAGIGGRVASEVGKRVHEIAAGRQVFVITHLPMIACQADQHFRVVKSIERGRTVTQVSAVTGREREEELARMLSGNEEKPEALKAARALLQEARKGSR